jgi:cellulose synthase/poly-beta-1,6-N-acetylglucosamine synthase-like glycosyltransferase
MTLGASVGLKGNGMVFAIDTLRNYDWSTSVTEDIELHMRLILNGERVTFAPDAQVLGEMPNTLQNSGSQHLRWESGKLEMARQYVPRLLRKSLGAAGRGQFRNAYLLLDAVFEYWIPPFSTLFGISGLLALVNLALMVFHIYAGQSSTQPFSVRLLQINLILCLFILIGQVLYLLAGLASIHAPRAIYRSLLYSPIYILWKNFQLLKTVLRRGPQEWVRTKRNEG